MKFEQCVYDRIISLTIVWQVQSFWKLSYWNLRRNVSLSALLQVVAPCFSFVAFSSFSVTQKNRFQNLKKRGTVKVKKSEKVIFFPKVSFSWVSRMVQVKTSFFRSNSSKMFRFRVGSTDSCLVTNPVWFETIDIETRVSQRRTSTDKMKMKKKRPEMAHF